MQEFDDVQLHEAALKLIADLRVAHEREVAETAIGWTVLCWDLKHGTCTVHGFWEKDDLVEVMRWSMSWQRELNRDIEEDQEGWRCDIMPVGPKDER